MMATRRELERRVTRLERDVASHAPSCDAAPCAIPPLSIPELREVLKTLLANAPTQAVVTMRQTSA